jgi:hypothetical protein
MKVEHKTNCRLESLQIDWNFVNDKRVANNYAKYLPIKVTRLMRAMYGQKCREHNHTMNRQHLREELQMKIDSMGMIRRHPPIAYNREEVLSKGKRPRQH